MGALDWHFVQVAYQATLTQGASVQLVFGFEYAVLLTMVAMVTVKYALHTYDINRDNPWEDKAVFLLYAELAIGILFDLQHLRKKSGHWSVARVFKWCSSVALRATTNEMWHIYLSLYFPPRDISLMFYRIFFVWRNSYVRAV